MPSYHEGLPISVLEAISCEARVLLSDIDQNKDIGLPAECYFRLGDVTDLHRGLRREGGCVEMHVLREYDWDGIVGQYVNNISKLI